MKLLVLCAVASLGFLGAEGCSFGFKKFDGVLGCFKIFPELSTWKQGRAKCLSYNLDMVKVTGDANQLRRALKKYYGQGTFWLGAEVDGSGRYRWLSGGYLSNSDSLWITGLPSHKNDRGNCLTLSVNDNSIRTQPSRPFGFGRCDDGAVRYKTICEGVKPTPVTDDPGITVSVRPGVG